MNYQKQLESLRFLFSYLRFNNKSIRVGVLLERGYSISVIREMVHSYGGYIVLDPDGYSVITFRLDPDFRISNEIYV